VKYHPRETIESLVRPGNWFLLNLKGSEILSKGDKGIVGMKTLLCTCYPPTISTSIALSRNLDPNNGLQDNAIDAEWTTCMEKGFHTKDPCLPQTIIHFLSSSRENNS
jgi:hypothetical protein